MDRDQKPATDSMAKDADAPEREYVTYANGRITRPLATDAESDANFAAFTRSKGVEPEEW